MASFIGTREDFNTYIGPRIRNLVNQIAKKDRDARNGVCQNCKEKVKLDSAHKHGKERKTLIKMALKDFDKGTYIDVDLVKFEELFIKFHQPINETFLFLCRKCHKEYDKNYVPDVDYTKETQKEILEDSLKIYSSDNHKKEIDKIERKINGWFLNREQKNSKILYAFIKLYKQNNGTVTYEQLKKKANIPVPEFKRNFDQMKNFSEKNHGKIFEQIGERIYLWEKVGNIIWERAKEYGV